MNNHPMSFAQERLWLVDVADPGTSTYNVALRNRWHEAVDPEALDAALTKVVARHEVLRTTYRLVDGSPVQIVGPVAAVPVEVLAGGPAMEAELADRARRAFDLGRGPLLRCTVWRGAPGGDVMLLVVHHIAVDGCSLEPLYADLAAAYRQVELPDLPMQYREFAVWDRKAVERDLVESRIAELADAKPPTLPGAGVPNGVGDQIAFSIPMWPKVIDLARSLRATPAVIMQAAFEAVLAQWSGSTDFVLGLVTANRTHPDSERLVGFFANTVPLRRLLRPEWTFRELCLDARTDGYRSLTYQRVPFNALAGHRRNLVTACLVVQNTPAPPTDLWTRPTVLPTGRARFELLMIIEDGAGALEFDTGRYPARIADGVVDSFLDLLDTMTANPETPLTRFITFTHRPSREFANTTPATMSTARRAHTAGVLTPAHRHAVEMFATALASVGRTARDLGPDADFFALGGHSLLAVTMLAGTQVSPRDFLAEPTIAGLARLLTIDHGPAEPPPAGPALASATQRRFWFLDRVPSLRQAYVMPTVVEIPAPVDIEALRRAVDETLANHLALRTTFALDRKLRQVVRAETRPARARIVPAVESCWGAFDLARQAPARADIVDRGEQGVLLVLVVHHIAADGWSRRLLLTEIADRYHGRTPARAVVTPPREPDRRHTEAMIDWLSEAPVDIELCRDRERPETQTTLAARQCVELPQLSGLAATPFQVGAALLAVALARRSGQRDFLFAFPWAGRDTEESLGAVGMYVNTVILRVDLRGVGTWRQLLKQVRESSAVSYRHADASYDEIAAALHPSRDLSRPPLTPVYLGVADEVTPDFPGARLRELDPLHIKFELECTITEDWRFDIAYLVGLFGGHTIAGLAAELRAAAVDLATDPDSETRA
ncbi:condensation domain-containing protein [Kutzneria sp. NPDC052558]|uniref:condensation domain-containing protein n=1 Tax=Kutzneria sp. NPDC052558 TaxID=3364121 RepID=UPI0037C90194